jgi:hypothetical protein
MKVPLLSAREAIVAIESTTSAPCSDCAMLLVTDARLTSGPIQTSRGRATAPVWEFTLQGTAVKLTRVAIANPVVVAPDEVGSGLGLAIDSASGTVGGNELTVAFVGPPDPGNMPCGEDYTAEAVESDLAVVVIVPQHPHAAPFGEACSVVGARRTTTSTLAAPARPASRARPAARHPGPRRAGPLASEMRPTSRRGILVGPERSASQPRPPDVPEGDSTCRRSSSQLQSRMSRPG